MPVLLGRLPGADAAAIASALAPLVDNRTLVVVSGDFTHYGPRFGYLPFPPDRRAVERIKQLDMGAWERIAAHDAEGLRLYHGETGITACGLGAIRVLVQLLGDSAEPELLAYRTSGGLTGNYVNSVSYLAAVFRAKDSSPGPPP